jgi:DNA-binding response OmpR family regulator
MKRILIVEDDRAINMAIKVALEAEEYRVTAETDGISGGQRAQTDDFDLIILDIMLPGKSGLDVCREIRLHNKSIPILMLTSKKEEHDIVLGLELGADDYMTKPFGLGELKARMKALLRRGAHAPLIVDYEFADVLIDFEKLEATKAGLSIKLSAREFDVLQLFIEYEGRVVSRDMLLNKVWGYETYPTTRTVDNYILNLRKKIETDPSHPHHILTMPKSGYKFIAAPQAQ